MYLLTEAYTWDQARCLMEGGGRTEDGKLKDLYMKGIFVQGGVRNHNQRVYPVSEIRRAVEQVNERMRAGESIVGEADHPEELNINIDRISHIITELYMDGPNGIGKLKILPTKLGNECRILLENGVKLGVSSRGSGNVTDSGDVTDFEMVTVDIVVRPSAPDAYPKPVYEALRYGRRAPIVRDLSEAMTYDPKAQDYLTKEMLDIINALKS